MRQKYKVILEVDAYFESQVDNLEYNLSDTIEKMFGVLATNINTERILSEEEKTILQGTCIDSQAEDQYCEKCPGGCIECQKRWLRQLGWEESDLPEKPFPLFEKEED